jgi:PST family polysaccharide transporter
MIAGVGINFSGVRQIAKAVGTGDSRQVAQTVITLRRVAFATGALGSALLFAFSKAVARFTFGDAAHAESVALLSFAVLLTDISAAQGALVQGMRRISDLARLSIWGALTGTIFSIPIVYVYGEAGVAPSIIAVAGMAILTSWWYARKIKIENISMTWAQLSAESSELLKLGVVFMASGILLFGSQYFVSIIVLHQLGLQASGLYQAAWALGGLYIGFIVNAMGADFYPRLTGVANDHVECNRLVNEQAEVGFLLAVPGVVGTLVLAPLIISAFYSIKFVPAIEVLRWITLGMGIRVVSWPIGYFLIAKGERAIFFWMEVGTYSLLVLLVWLGVHFLGLKGAGIGFFGMNIAQTVAYFFIIQKLTGFQWSPMNRRMALLFWPLIVAVFASWYFLTAAAVLVIGIAAIGVSSYFCLRMLSTLIPPEALPGPAVAILRFLRFLPPEIDLQS